MVKTVTAYILVNSKMNRVINAMDKISCIHGIENVAIVSGIFDIIVRATAPHMTGISHISDTIHATGDVEKTVTHIVTKENKR